MTLQKRWPCAIAILCLSIAHAAPPSAPEPQRSFPSAEEAVNAFQGYGLPGRKWANYSSGSGACCRPSLRECRTRREWQRQMTPLA
jgi:hypothetical protein